MPTKSHIHRFVYFQCILSPKLISNSINKLFIKNYRLSGIGCTLYVINKNNNKILVKTDILHPDNIHGIIHKSNNILIVYGGKSLCACQLKISDDNVR